MKAVLIAGQQSLQGENDAQRLDRLVARVRGEYSEMPGLQLTLDQARRLWQVDVATCKMVLERLVQNRFLRKTSYGSYVSVSEVRRSNNVDR